MVDRIFFLYSQFIAVSICLEMSVYKFIAI